MKRTVAAVCGILAVLLTALGAGDPAPSFVNPDLNRSYVYSKNLYLKNVVLIDFFRTDCVPCIEKLPELEALVQSYKDKGLTGILMANDTEGHDLVKPFFASRPTPFTVLVDRYQTAAKAFGVTAIPMSFVIDKTGTIAYAGADVKEIKATVKKLLGE